MTAYDQLGLQLRDYTDILLRGLGNNDIYLAFVFEYELAERLIHPEFVNQLGRS